MTSGGSVADSGRSKYGLPMPTTLLPITLLYGGMTALLVTLLGLHVSLLRLRHRVSVGKDLPAILVRPVRAHGNAAEWAPLGILLLAVLELSGVGSVALHALGGALVASRVLHAAGVLGRNLATLAGATITYLLMTVMSVWAIALHFAH